MDIYRHEIADLLGNGPSSFAAMYRFIVHISEHPEAKVIDVMTTVRSMASEGILHIRRMSNDGHGFQHVKAEEIAAATQTYRDWLEERRLELSISDVSFDEVGLWLKLHDPREESTCSTPPMGCRHRQCQPYSYDPLSRPTNWRRTARELGKALQLNPRQKEP